jgi:hypothetical protein
LVGFQAGSPVQLNKEETEDCCEDCKREQCWRGSICSEIKKDLLSDIAYEKTEEL